MNCTCVKIKESLYEIEVSFVNVLITGGAGFIGSHVAERLLKNQHQVTIIDFLHPYYSKKRKLEHLNRIKTHGDFHFYQIDLLNEQACKEVFFNHPFDVVLHLAALPGVPYSIEKPLAYVDYDIKATINVLKLAGETKVRQVIFASSSSVYGEKKEMPLKEAMATGNVVSPYAAAKFGAESFCHAYQHLYQFQLTILRFFTVYGPWGRPDMATPKFIKKLIHGEPIDIFGEKTARDYTYIDDIVDGIERAIQTPFTNEIMNLGSGEPITIEALVEHFHAHFPNIEINHHPFRTGDVNMTWADINKAKKLLHYKPKISFEEGLTRTIEWAKKYESL